MPVRLDSITEKGIRLSDIHEDMPMVEIDPQVIAKKRTSEVFGTIFGMDEKSVNATYNNLTKNFYGEELKPLEVQQRMEEDGFQLNPDFEASEVASFTESMLNRKQSDIPAMQQQRAANRQIYNTFRAFIVVDDLIFDERNEWYREKIANKPEGKEGTVYSMPVYKTEDLLDFDTYMSLLEQSATKQNIKELRHERKALLAQLSNESLSKNTDYYDSLEWSEFTTGSKVQDVTLEAAKGLYTALKTIERGVWSTSVAMGVAWNQTSLERVEEQLNNAKLTPIKAAGKIGYVTGEIAEAIPNFAYNMTVGNPGIFITEYGNAKQNALNDGASNTEADLIAVPVATINTIIEGWQIDRIYKLAGMGKGAKQAIKKTIKDRAYKAFLKSGAKFTGVSVKTAINEGIEGFTQEGVSIAIPGFIIGNYPKDENGRIDWVTIASRMGQSGIGEGLGGLLLGTGGAVYNARQAQNYKNDIAGSLIMNEGIETNAALEVATNIVERLRNNEGTPKEIYREEVGKVKKADNRAKAAAHIIQKGKQIPDGQYRRIAKETTDKESMVDMTYEEGEKFIAALNQATPEKVETEEPVKEITEQELMDEIEAIKEETPAVTPKEGEIAPPAKPQEQEVAPQITKAEILMTADKTKDGLFVPEIVETKTDRGDIAPKKYWKEPAKFFRKFVQTVPEFAENPVFVVKDGKLVYQDGGKFTIEPEFLGLKSDQITEGQKIRLDLESYGVKMPPAKKIAQAKALGLRGGFLSNTPFGDKGKFQAKIDEVMALAEEPPKVTTEEKKKSLKELKRTDTLATFVNTAESAVKSIDRAFGIMSTRIKNISLKLFQEVRNKYVNPVKMIIADRTKKVHPFVDAIEQRLSEEDKYEFEVARWTENIDEVERLINKYNLQSEYDIYRIVFDLMYHEGKAVGMDMNYVTAYFPSKVKDLDDAQDKKGRPLAKEEQIQIIDTLLRGFRTTGLTLAPPGFTRARTLIREDTSLIKYYYGFAETTSRYIESMTENIQARKFFGKQTKEIVQLRANISRNKTNIAKWEKDTEKDRTDSINQAKERLEKYESELLRLDDGTLKNSIGDYVLDLINEGTINYDQQVELRQIFDGLFSDVGSNRWIHTARSLEYVGSLAQVPALITQYSEVVLSVLKAPGSTLPNWVRAHLGKSKIKLRDIGVAHIGQEWADADLNASMTKLMSVFEKVDKVGKETFINSVIDKYRKLAETNPDKVREELNKYYPESQHNEIIESLKSGIIDNNIKGFALNEIADVQPISKMEVPELYAKAGNLRVFYMYKTFTLKRLDIMRNQAYGDIKKGIKTGSRRLILKGLAKLVWLAFMFTLADSTADIVKDVIRGKPIDELPDYIVDNLLQMILLSKYSAGKARKEGISAFFKNNIALPISNVDAAVKDFMTLIDEDSEKGSETLRRIPWIGDLYYWYFGEGARKVEEGVYD